MRHSKVAVIDWRFLQWHLEGCKVFIQRWYSVGWMDNCCCNCIFLYFCGCWIWLVCYSCLSWNSFLLGRVIYMLLLYIIYNNNIYIYIYIYIQYYLYYLCIYYQYTYTFIISDDDFRHKTLKNLIWHLLDLVMILDK